MLDFGNISKGRNWLKFEDSNVGYDCGEWVEKRVESGEWVENDERGESGGRVEHAFDFRLAKDPAERWDLAKVTTRGKGDSAASIAAQLTKPHFYIVIR